MERTKRVSRAVESVLAAGYEIEFENEQEIETMNYDTGRSATIRPDGTVNTIRLDRWETMLDRQSGII